jgi:hypothetical protein
MARAFDDAVAVARAAGDRAGHPWLGVTGAVTSGEIDGHLCWDGSLHAPYCGGGIS